MKKQILFCSLFLLTAMQIWAQSPLSAFAHEADQHQAKAGHFATPIHSIDTLLLPFYEDWESGTFTQHSWQTECVNWTINTVLGFPGKCAEFTWNPVLTNYSCGTEHW